MAESKYTIIILAAAEKNLRKLNRQQFLKVDETIQSLKDEPRPQGCKKLKGYDNTYRVRVGDYRIVYTIQNQQLIIEIVRVASRKDAYKNL